jgi:hypothetical protein
MLTSFARWSLGMLLVLGCGGAKAPVESPDTPPPAESPASAPEPAPTDTAPAPAPEPASTSEAAPSESAGSGVETRTSEVIAQVIKDNRKPFRDCYDKGKQKIPELEGTLTLFFVLNPRGEVKKAELNRERSDIVEPIVVDCALGVLRSMKFPRSSRGMESTVNYPFDFRR